MPPSPSIPRWRSRRRGPERSPGPGPSGGVSIALDRALGRVAAADPDVAVVRPDDVRPPAGASVVLCRPDLSTRLDPAAVVPPPVLVGAVAGLPDDWARRRGLEWFDALVCTAPDTADRLAGLYRGPLLVHDPDEDGDDDLSVFLDDVRRRSRPRAFLAFQPNWWQHPYVQRLYAQLRDAGVRAVPVDGPADVLASPVLRAGPTVYHLQWTAPIVQPATSADGARAAAERFLADLDALQALDIPAIWTLHNALPHDGVHVDAELTLRRGLADRCDVVHLLEAGTRSMVDERLGLPADRIRVLPYTEDPVVAPPGLRAETRRELGFADDDVVYLFFGRIRAYKQLDRLVDAFARHRRTHPDARLLVAGAFERFPGSTRLGLRLRAAPGVVTRIGRVPDGDVAAFFAAADATVISYEIMNSAVAVTSVAHGCPVVGPAAGALPDVVDDAGLLFEPGRDLAAVLDDVHHLVRSTDLGERARNLAATRSATAMASDFAALVSRLAPPGAG